MLGDLIKSALGPILDGVLRFIPDKNKREEARENFELQMLGAMQGLIQGQLKINEVQAQHGSIFVAGARPFIMWVCGVALGWNYLLQPIFNWGIYVTVLSGHIDMETANSLQAPTLDTGELTTILLGMLGLGGLRTYEKRLGVARSDIKKEGK
jgi:hypothetical protein